VFDLSNARDITIRKAAAPARTEMFLQTQGHSGNIQLEDCAPTRAGTAFSTGNGVVPDSVVIKGTARPPVLLALRFPCRTTGRARCHRPRQPAKCAEAGPLGC
jgi:hypothetical protein